MKIKAVIALVAFTLVICVFLDEDGDSQRRILTCKTIPELIAEMDDSEVRKLHKAPYDSKTLYERLLELADEEPCLTQFPSHVREAIAEEETIEKMTEPVFEVAKEDDDLYEYVDDDYFDDDYAYEEEVTDDTPILDKSERELTESFEPEARDIGEMVDGAIKTGDGSSTIAYAVALTGCPESYKPPVDTTGEPPLAPDLYEASAILKTGVCETCEIAATNRRLGITRKLAMLENRTSSAEMGYVMHALVHPMAIECSVDGISTTDTYDRVKLMKSVNYQVDIVGHSITHVDLENGQQYYLLENIEDDVGIRDSTKLHIWRMTYHPVVVLMNHNSILQQPLDAEIDTLMADDNLKGMYILNAPDPETGGAGVDTGLLIIKPDLDEYSRIVNAYINTTYVEKAGWNRQNTTYFEGGGWNGQGYNNFSGRLGISGFLAYYFDTNPGYMKLDRCIYAHDADDICNSERNVVDSKASKLVTESCGNPRECPYDHPSWTQTKKEQCSSLHKNYYNYRYQFEQKYFNKATKQERIGMFKLDSFLGYCAGAGKKYALPLVGEIIPKPEWQNICPPDVCPQGTFLKPDCTCTEFDEDPCNACPENTYCQREPNLICIDCNCGFCDSGSAACCNFDGVNNCMDGPGNTNDCAMQMNFFPAFPGYGNACGGVELSRTTVPNGCGCKPSNISPCTYNREWGTSEEKCFICTAADLANGECGSCKDCIRSCTDTSCIDEAVSEDDYVNCLNSIQDSTCRTDCHGYCMKSDFLTFGGESTSLYNGYSSTKAPDMVYTYT